MRKYKIITTLTELFFSFWCCVILFGLCLKYEYSLRLIPAVFFGVLFTYRTINLSFSLKKLRIEIQQLKNLISSKKGNY